MIRSAALICSAAGDSAPAGAVPSRAVPPWTIPAGAGRDSAGRDSAGRDRAALGADQVEVLAADHLGPQRGEQAQHRGEPVRAQPGVTQGGVGPGEGLETEDERRRPAELGARAWPAVPAVRAGQPDVRGGLPAPDGRAVHQVVTDERAGVQQLDRAADPQGGVGIGPGGRAPGGPVSPVDERRAEPLARAADETAEHFVEGSAVGAQEIQFSDPPADHGGQFRLDELARPGHLGGRGGNLTDLHSHDPAILSAGVRRMPSPGDSAGSGPGGCMRPAQAVACAPAAGGGGPGRRAAAGSYGRITAATAVAPQALPGTPADPCLGGIPSSRSPGIGRLKYPSDYQ